MSVLTDRLVAGKLKREAAEAAAKKGAVPEKVKGYKEMIQDVVAAATVVAEKMEYPDDPMEGVITKRCVGRCRRFREPVYFNKSKKFTDGYEPVCIDCQAAQDFDLKSMDAGPTVVPSRRKRNRPRVVTLEHYKVRRLLVAASTRAIRAEAPYDLQQHTQELEARLKLGRCEMTKLPFDMDTPLAYNAPALYPVDPAKEMVYSNIRIICWGMLCALGTWGPKDLETLVTAWLEHQ